MYSWQKLSVLYFGQFLPFSVIPVSKHLPSLFHFHLIEKNGIPLKPTNTMPSVSELIQAYDRKSDSDKKLYVISS